MFVKLAEGIQGEHTGLSINFSWGSIFDRDFTLFNLLAPPFILFSETQIN
jgi:hypothetical protein